MLLTKDYTRITSSDNFLYGWITDKNEYIEGDYTHTLMVLRGNDNYMEAIIEGWIRVAQEGKFIYCELHHSRFKDSQRLLQQLISPRISGIYFDLYDSRGIHIMDKELDVVDGQIE